MLFNIKLDLNDCQNINRISYISTITFTFLISVHIVLIEYHLNIKYMAFQRKHLKIFSPNVFKSRQL